MRLTVESIDEPDRDLAAMARLKAGIANMRFFSKGPLPSRENCMITVDTNILIYACDQVGSPRASSLLSTAPTGLQGVVPTINKALELDVNRSGFRLR